MKRVSEQEIRSEFIGWQCRIRQIAMREYEGRPLAGMMACVSSRKGDVLAPTLVTLLLHEEPQQVTDHFRFLVQKTPDPQKIREAGLRFLAGDYYQQPELFADGLTAVFGAASAIAEEMIARKTVLLSFSQFSQTYRMFCRVRRLKPREASREASLWHNRLFNPGLANDAEVLAFMPDWKTAQSSKDS